METVDASGLEVGTHIGQWSSDGSRHDGHRVSNGLVSLARNISTDAQNDIYTTISVVIPVLDEIDRLPLVLEKLITFDWIGYSLVPEFIVVDGGSSDGSAGVVASFPVVKGIQLKSGTGRGEAIAAGIRAAKGNFVVTFPSDDEYDVVAIAEVAGLLKTSHAPIVFGSRIGLCADTDKRLREIYGGRTRAYYMSKWGGFTLSIFSGVLYKRWISDTLTSIKGFTRIAVESLSLEGQSADWDMQVIIDASKSEIAIAEVPVGFRPRRVDQGKKIRPKDGIRAMIALFAGIRRKK
jgi:glycosyltransferase involved in cell wall biosynthesis